LVILLKKNKYKNIKINHKLIINVLLNYYNNILILIYQNKFNNIFNLNNIYNIKYIKTKFFINEKIKKKVLLNFFFYFKYKFENILINIINLKQYNNYKNIYNKNLEILYLLISFLYKKNNFAFLINKQELYKMIIPINKNYYLLNINNVSLQKKLNLYIINFFNILDKTIYNYCAPN
jgi:hypothetical protein